MTRIAVGVAGFVVYPWERERKGSQNKIHKKQSRGLMTDKVIFPEGEEAEI